MPTTVLMIRHADVENPGRVLYGHLPGFGLSASGRAQAEALGRRLRGADVRRIVHSPLERAAETARIIASQLEAPVPLIPEPELREADFSRYLQGVPYWQVPVRRPLWFAHKARRGLVPGDEAVGELGGRVLEVALRLAREHPGETSALVSHADPLQAAWVLIEGRPHNEREMYRRAVDRAGTLELQIEDGRIVAHSYVAPPETPRRSSPAAASDAAT
ncbi:MAG: histidine phosphatase family protein [Candidatus Dormibacterales bacterium]